MFYFTVQEEDPNRAVKKQLGDTNYYCPVALKDKAVLWPGNPEVAARYREKTYYLSTPANRDRFLQKPTTFLPTIQPFIVSLLLLAFLIRSCHSGLIPTTAFLFLVSTIDTPVPHDTIISLCNIHVLSLWSFSFSCWVHPLYSPPDIYLILNFWACVYWSLFHEVLTKVSKLTSSYM